MRGARLLVTALATCLVEQSQARVAERNCACQFHDPPVQFRPKFRYWLPDASVPNDVVRSDIANISSIGGGGLEFLPFYLYGWPQAQTLGIPPPTDWNAYGFGTPAFQGVFKGALQASDDNNVLMDFAVGANQGQGVPSIPATPGLAVQLMPGNASIRSGSTFNGPVPPPQQLPASIRAPLSTFMHDVEQFTTPNLTAVIALQVLSTSLTNISGFGGAFAVPTVHFNESSVVDLTQAARDGTLTWTAPAGNSEWRIFSFWEDYTNQRSSAGGVNATYFIGNGSWTVDHFSNLGASRTTDFLDTYVFSDNEIMSLLRTVGNYAWEDSQEILSTLYWTPGLLQRFESARGYSLVKYLPLLYNNLNSWAQAFPPFPEFYAYGNYTANGVSVHDIDYRTTLNEGYQDYLAHFLEWSHARGFQYSIQPAYNLPLQMLADIPLVDAPEGESLGFSDVVDKYRQLSGPAHLTGKNVISSEVGAVNVPAYSQTIPNLLYHMKRSWAGGLTMMVIHGSPYSGSYTNTTWPGYTTFFYMYTDMWNRIQPAWQHMKDALDYIGRNQYIVQKGVPKVDLALYLFSDPWRVTVQYQSNNLQALGYTYDYLAPNNLQLPQAIVENQTLAANGPAYKALVFSNQTVISTQAANSILQLARAGLPIFIVGQPPNQTQGASQENELQVLNTVGNLLSVLSNVYQVASASQLPASLAQAGILPRTSLQCSNGPVYNFWRSDLGNGSEYVYIYNDQSQAASCEASFTTQSGAVPYIYDAWTGTQEPLLQYSRTESELSFPIQLQANETVIFAFSTLQGPNAPSPGSAITYTSGNIATLEHSCSGQITASLLGPADLGSASGQCWSFDSTPPPSTNLASWDISIEDWHAPANRYIVETAITMHYFQNQTLVPWTQLGPGMANVSGVGRYNTTFTAPSLGSASGSLGAFLSLGPVVHTMRAFINGNQLQPIDPTNPTIDISDYIYEGKTIHLTVEVTTPLFNRIKADANETMIYGAVAGVIQPLYAALPPQQYGLLGPVEVIWTVREQLV